MLQQLLQLSSDGQSVSLTAQPLNEPDLHISHSDIHALLFEYQAQDFYRFDNAIDSALAILNSSADEKAEAEKILVAEKRDASLLIKTDEDGMTSYITVVGAYGGQPVQGGMLIDALKTNQITKGIRRSSLQQLLKDAQHLQPGEKTTVAVAFGRLPEDGKDSQFISLVEDARSRVLRPQEKSDGSVDMRNLGDMVMVKEGSPVMKRIPATAGKDGYSVVGKVLAAKPGKELNFKPGKGTEISADNENLLIATMAGMPLIKERGIEVDDALSLRAVNVTTGHVSFDGSIVINGDISPGMKVKASGNIVVGGFIENAEVEAGGDIEARQGIIGRQNNQGDEFSCSVKAKGLLVSKFAQYAVLDAGRDISLSLYALHCRIRTSGALQVTDATERQGTLSGGVTEAGLGVKVVNLGATAGTPTEVIAFSHYRAVRNKMTKLVAELKQENKQLRNIEDAELKLLKIPEAKRPSELVEKIHNLKTTHSDKLQALRQQYDETKLNLEQQLEKYNIIAVNRVYPGVNCHFSKEAKFIAREHGPSKISFSGTAIEVSPI